MKSQIKLVLATVLVFLTLTSFASNIQDVKEKSLTHIIICWLDKSVKSNDIEVIINETKKLNSIPGVSGFSVGKSIKSNRDIVDDSFTFAVSMKFKNMKEMNTYEVYAIC